MQPFVPPPVTSFDPFIALAWGLMLAAVPLFFLVVFAIMRRKKSFVAALALVAVAFAAGANLISPLDTARQTQANRDAVVSEWLDENYPQYGGAQALLPYFNSGQEFSAVADSGEYTNLRFSYSPESGYRLASFPGPKAVDVVPMNERLDVAGQREKNAEPQS